MDYSKKILDFLKENKGVITSKDCQKLNIPTVYLTRLKDKGDLIKISRGIYVSYEVDYDEMYFFQLRYKKAIYSYESSLYLLGLTDKIVTNFEVSVYNSYKFNERDKRLVVHYVNKDIYELGVKEVKTKFGNTVRCYSVERVLCDFILNKRDIDQEVYFKLLKNYLKYKDKNIHELIDISSKLGVEDTVRQLLEVLS